MIALLIAAMIVANVPDTDNASDAERRAHQTMANRICQSVHLGNAAAHSDDTREVWYPFGDLANTIDKDGYSRFSEDGSNQNDIQSGWQIKCARGLARQEWQGHK